MKPWHLFYCPECEEVFTLYDKANPACSACTNRHILPLSKYIQTVRKYNEPTDPPVVPVDDNRGFISDTLQRYIQKARNCLCGENIQEGKPDKSRYKTGIWLQR